MNNHNDLLAVQKRFASRPEKSVLVFSPQFGQNWGKAQVWLLADNDEILDCENLDIPIELFEMAEAEEWFGECRSAA
jgi:hypothetical protein